MLYCQQKKQALRDVRNAFVHRDCISEHKKIALDFPAIFCAENSKITRGIFMHPKIPQSHQEFFGVDFTGINNNKL